MIYWDELGRAAYVAWRERNVMARLENKSYDELPTDAKAAWKDIAQFVVQHYEIQRAKPE